MADKYLYNNGGVPTEKEFTTSSTGATDAGKGVGLDPTGRLDDSMMPVGIGKETVSVTTSEALNSGDFVNIYTDTGVAKCRKADASVAGKEAHGFVLASFLSGVAATVYLPGQINTARTGMAPGAKQYLSVTAPGGTQETVPTGSAQLIQPLGMAVSATEIPFTPGTMMVLATVA